MKNLLAENMRRFGTKNLKENIKTNSDFNETVKDIMDGDVYGDNEYIIEGWINNSRDQMGGSLRVTIEANNEDEAMDKAIEQYGFDGISYIEKVTATNENPKENIKTNSDFNETVKDIMDGGARGENMTDTILAELGDFYTEIYNSGDTNLIRLYNQLRMSADETPDIQRYSASKLFKYLGTKNV